MYKTKDNENFKLEKRRDCSGKTPCYYITALSEQNKKIGELSFKISDNSILMQNEEHTAWLYHIWVAEEYLNRGVGHTLITEFESTCAKNQVFNIEAKYSPFGAGGMRTKDFYINHNYTIEKNDCDMFILKTLQKSQEKSFSEFEKSR